LRSRIKGTPPGVSYVKLLADSLRGRKVLWFGDSLAQQFKHFLAMRASEVGVNQTLLFEDETFVFKESLAGPAYFEHNMGKDRKSFPWEKWDATSAANIAAALKRYGEQGAVIVYNAGLHNTPAGQSKTKHVMNASQLTAVEEEYRAVVRHTLGMLEKVCVCQRLSALDPHSMAQIYVFLCFFSLLAGSAPREWQQFEAICQHFHGNDCAAFSQLRGRFVHGAAAERRRGAQLKGARERSARGRALRVHSAAVRRPGSSG
jgi:hypothetical protein